jgi:hypothetical protein
MLIADYFKLKIFLRKMFDSAQEHTRFWAGLAQLEPYKF